MSSSLTSVVCSGLIIVVACGALRGQDKPSTGAKPASLRLKDTEVKSLLKQLGAAKESDRDAAIKKLREAGMAVIPDLADVAASGNRHATINAIEILKAHVEGADPEARTAAFAEVRKLSTGSRSEAAVPAKKIVEAHKDLLAEFDAAWRAKLAARAELAAKNPSPPKTAPPKTNRAPMPADPLTALRRQGIEQSIKDAETAIEKIKQLKLPKQLESEQISAVNQALQKLRSQLKELDSAGRKK